MHEEADDLLEAPPVFEKVLSSTERRGLGKRNFAIPSQRKYPIEDKAHARNALSRVSANGTEAEKQKVRSAVHRKYPSIGEAEKLISLEQSPDQCEECREIQIGRRILELTGSEIPGDALADIKDLAQELIDMHAESEG